MNPIFIISSRYYMTLVTLKLQTLKNAMQSRGKKETIIIMLTFYWSLVLGKTNPNGIKYGKLHLSMKRRSLKSEQLEKANNVE